MMQHSKDIMASGAAPARNTPDLEVLEAIADWRDDLIAKITRTRLIFEFHDCETDIEPLIEEVAAFKRVVSCLTWRGDIS